MEDPVTNPPGPAADPTGSIYPQTQEGGKHVVLAALLMLIGAGIGVVWTLITRPSKMTKPTPLEVIGVIRSTGLSEDKLVELGLSDVRFQVTDFADSHLVEGYFLQSNIIAEELIGKCVLATGIVPPGWQNRDLEISSRRSVLEVADIRQIDYSKCSPVADHPNPSPEKSITVSGTARHISRAGVDIGYDYQLVPVIPFTDRLNSMGENILISQIVMIPASNSVWTELEKNLGRPVTVRATFEWGYAESRYLLVTDVSENSEPAAQTQSLPQITNSYYDESCNIQITLSSQRKVTIPTDFAKSGRLRCYQIKQILESPGKQYVVFEGSKQQPYLGVFFAGKNQEVILWRPGNKVLGNLSIDNSGILHFTAADPNATSAEFNLTYNLPYIDQHWNTLVNPITKELITTQF